jgi:hypothetical protein
MEEKDKKKLTKAKQIIKHNYVMGQGCQKAEYFAKQLGLSTFISPA